MPTLRRFDWTLAGRAGALIVGYDDDVEAGPWLKKEVICLCAGSLAAPAN